jgi:hypothetical protein
MDAPTTITVHFPGEVPEVFNDITLLQLALRLEGRGYTVPQEPLLLELAAPAKKLYYEPGILHWYITGQSAYAEVLEALWCDGLYRNINSLVTQNESHIDAGHLWLRRGEELLLINHDDFVHTPFKVSESLFTKVL